MRVFTLTVVVVRLEHVFVANRHNHKSKWGKREYGQGDTARSWPDHTVLFGCMEERTSAELGLLQATLSTNRNFQLI